MSQRTIKVAVEGFDSESVREIGFVFINVNFEMTLNEYGRVIVDIFQLQSELHGIS